MKDLIYSDIKKAEDKNRIDIIEINRIIKLGRVFCVNLNKGIFKSLKLKPGDVIKIKMSVIYREEK